jgi:predicted MPP superfamily phosphohydrolase
MKLQIISDIHLEKRPEPKIKKTGASLAILGDIDHYPFTKGKILIDKLSKEYDNIFVILGNHEYYSKEISLEDMGVYIKSLFKQTNVHILCNEIIEIDNCVIAGTTLWSYIPLSQQEYYNQ